jgi:hypothetical protein
MKITRTRFSLLLIVLGLTPLLTPTVRAQDTAIDADSDLDLDEMGKKAKHNTFITARVSAWMPSLDGNVLNENNVGIGTNLNFDTNLDLGETVTEAAFDITLKLNRQEIRVSSFQFNVSGIDTAASAITFGNLTFNPGDAINTDFKASNLKILHGFAPLKLGNNGFRVGLLAGVNIYDIDINVTDVLSVASDSINKQIPLPVIGAYTDIPLGQFFLSGEVSGLQLTVSNVEAYYFDVSGTLTWRPLPVIGVFAGYRSITADLTTDDFDIDAQLEGFFFGGEIRF